MNPARPAPLGIVLPQLSAALIAVFEGCKLTAYKDSGGVWTVGIGHTGPDVHEGMTITREQADELLAKDQAHLFKMVEDKPLLEAAALVSFGYNCGSGTLAKVLAGTSLLMDFVKDRKGNILPGLVSRRTLEDALILTSWQIEGKNA